MAGLDFADAFIPADLPTDARVDEDILEFYPNVEAYLYAVADALREEYRAIADAGLIVQLDLAALTTGSRRSTGRRRLHERGVRTSRSSTTRCGAFPRSRSATTTAGAA